MFTQTFTQWVKSLFVKFQQPQAYGNELEQYIIAHNPQSTGDVDRLTRQYDQRVKGWMV